MRRLVLLSALTIITVLPVGTALANVCQTDNLLCATTMPVDGYCECHARGAAEGGTVMPKAPPGARINATAGGCGAQPGAPGCR